MNQQQWRPTRWTAAQLEERRRAAATLFLHVTRGTLSQTAVAQRLGVSRSAVNQWYQAWRAGGVRRLAARPKTGRPAKLTAAQWQRLRRLLRRGAIAAGFETEHWTLKRVARVRTTWAPVGRPPVLHRVSQRHEISSIIAVTLEGRLAAWHVRGAAKGLDVVRALKHFQHALDRRLLIIWDRGSAHRAACGREYVAACGRDLHVQWLPAYAPELNPEEQANGVLKGRMANALPDSVDALKGLACRGIRYLQRHPTLVRHFFVHAGLHVNEQA